MRSTAQCAVDSQDIPDPPGIADSPGTQALPGIPASPVRAESRGLRLSLDNVAFEDHPLVVWAPQDLRGPAFPIAERDSRRVGLCIAQPMEIAPDDGIGTVIAGAARGRSDRTPMDIRGGPAIPILM